MKRNLVLVFALMVACACQSAGKRGFEWSLSVWTETLSWSEENGFNLVFRAWNKPMLAIQRDDGGYAYVDAVGTGVCLRAGQRYMLTNGRGRSQFFKVCPLPFEEPGFDAPSTFPSGRAVLTFEHSERISRDWKTRHERYVVSSGGDVYDCETKMLSKRGMPMVLPDPWTPPDVRARQNVLDVSERRRVLAMETRDAAWKELMRLDAVRALAGNGTNTVCYSTAGRFGAEEVRKMTKDGVLSPCLEELVSQFGPGRSQVGKWAQLCVENGDVRIAGLTERFGDGSRRQSRFYPSGDVNMVTDEFSAGKMTIVYHYDTAGKWVWQIKMRNSNAFEFWRVENGRVNESSDLELAQRLAEQETIEDVK